MLLLLVCCGCCCMLVHRVDFCVRSFEKQPEIEFFMNGDFSSPRHQLDYTLQMTYLFKWVSQLQQKRRKKWFSVAVSYVSTFFALSLYTQYIIFVISRRCEWKFRIKRRSNKRKFIFILRKLINGKKGQWTSILLISDGSSFSSKFFLFINPQLIKIQKMYCRKRSYFISNRNLIAYYYYYWLRALSSSSHVMFNMRLFSISLYLSFEIRTRFSYMKFVSSKKFVCFRRRARATQRRHGNRDYKDEN